MANKNSIITMPQIERFKPETTARWLREYLYTSSRDEKSIDNYLAHIRLTKIIYDVFAVDRDIMPLDYHEEVFQIYRQREWTPKMTAFFLGLRDTLFPQEWAIVWKTFYRVSRKKLLAKVLPNEAEVMHALDQMALEVLGADFLNEESAAAHDNYD